MSADDEWLAEAGVRGEIGSASRARPEEDGEESEGELETIQIDGGDRLVIHESGDPDAWLESSYWLGMEDL